MNDPAPDLIRITREDALGSHVDDLLKRQMSLRGEPGVTRDRGRKWYYQNWFVFLVVGALGALCAWALIEPYFDDLHYIQGELTAIDSHARLPPGYSFGDERATDPRTGTASFNIRDQKLYCPCQLLQLGADGRRQRIDVTALQPGQIIGAYADYIRTGDFDLAYARFVVLDPPPQSPARAALTLDQLDARSKTLSLVIFSLVAGLVGLFLGAADGVVCRLPRRALLCGTVGLLVGLVGGLLCSLIANLAYAPLTALASKQHGADGVTLTTFGFLIQLFGRSVAWGLAGLAMGLGQGMALRSHRLLLYGLLGGVVGGLLGGMFFDPIDLILLGPDRTSAHWSRLIGFVIIGMSVGGTIGVVELLARDAWLRMTQGPLRGKEFLLFKDVMKIGSSPRSDVYLFNDSKVAEHHATLRSTGDRCEIEAAPHAPPLLLNNRAISRALLHHGDNVTIGQTVFVFQQRKT